MVYNLGAGLDSGVRGLGFTSPHILSQRQSARRAPSARQSRPPSATNRKRQATLEYSTAPSFKADATASRSERLGPNGEELEISQSARAQRELASCEAASCIISHCDDSTSCPSRGDRLASQPDERASVSGRTAELPARGKSASESRPRSKEGVGRDAQGLSSKPAGNESLEASIAALQARLEEAELLVDTLQNTVLEQCLERGRLQEEVSALQSCCNKGKGKPF